MFEYYYAWKNNEKRQTLYKRACRVVARGGMNSCLIEFENGQREVVSRNAVKRLTKRAPDVCPVCNGKGSIRVGVYSENCEACNGTGKHRSRTPLESELQNEKV